MSSSKILLLSKYRKNVADLRLRAKAMHLSDSEINKIFQNCFTTLQNQNATSSFVPKSTFGKVLMIAAKLFFCFAFLIFVLYILLNVHQPTSSIVLRNVQGLIYPGLKVLRFLAVPVLKRFPSLTNLYDETCLVENPYFFVSDMECWPCENVHSVIDLTGFNNHSLYQSGIPYIVQTTQKYVNFTNLHMLYKTNKHIFDTDANSVKSTNSSIRTVEDLFNYSPSKLKSSKTHLSWRVNRMTPARFLRSLFPRPYIVSQRSGQSMERFVMIDEPFAEAYSLPNPECSYVVVIQGSGERTIILKPSKECGNTCRTVSVVLKPSFVLWYNWWYWRPISLPLENGTEVSVSYLSCYC